MWASSIFHRALELLALFSLLNLGLAMPYMAVDGPKEDGQNTPLPITKKRPVVTVTMQTTFCSLCITTNTTMAASTTTSTVPWISSTTIVLTSTMEESFTTTSTDTTTVELASTITALTDISSILPHSTGFFTITPWTSGHTIDNGVPEATITPESLQIPMSSFSTYNNTSTFSGDIGTVVSMPYYGNSTTTAAPAMATTLTTLTALTTLTTMTTIVMTYSAAPSTIVTCSATLEPSTTTTPCPDAGPRDMANFTIDFDDIPPLINTEGAMQTFPLFSPHHRMWFSKGFDIMPSSASPFDPSSPNMLVRFEAPELRNETSSDDVPPDTAYIGLGPLTSLPCMRFDFLSFDLGCLSSRPSCDFRLFARRENVGDGHEYTISELDTEIPACKDASNCKLTTVSASSFANLTSLWVMAKVDKETVVWWGDDLSLSWTKTTCAAAMCRSQVPDYTFKRSRARRGNSWW